jgi:hypothetical protein
MVFDFYVKAASDLTFSRPKLSAESRERYPMPIQEQEVQIMAVMKWDPLHELERMADQMLHLHLPKSEKAKPKQIHPGAGL